MIRQTPKGTRPAPTDDHRAKTLARLVPEAIAKPAATGVRLWSAAVRTVDAFERHIGRYGLSSGRFGLLLTLFGAAPDPLAPSEVAERLGVSRPTVSHLADALVKAELVQRVDDAASRRRRPLALTEAGREQMAEVAPDHFQRLASALSVLTPDEQVTLLAALPLIDRFMEELLGSNEEES